MPSQSQMSPAWLCSLSSRRRSVCTHLAQMATPLVRSCTDRAQLTVCCSYVGTNRFSGTVPRQFSVLSKLFGWCAAPSTCRLQSPRMCTVSGSGDRPHNSTRPLTRGQQRPQGLVGQPARRNRPSSVLSVAQPAAVVSAPPPPPPPPTGIVFRGGGGGSAGCGWC